MKTLYAGTGGSRLPAGKPSKGQSRLEPVDQAACWKAFEGPESKGPKNPWPKKGVQPITGMGVAGSVIRIQGGLPENSNSIPTLQHQIA